MKITKRQLRRIIRETTGQLSENVLNVKNRVYPSGWDVEDGEGEWVAIGEMIKFLLGAGETDFFHNATGLDKLKDSHARGVQGGMERWDSDVFEEYYSVDVKKMIDLYAEINGMQVNHISDEPEYEDDGTNDFEEYYS